MTNTSAHQPTTFGPTWSLNDLLYRYPQTAPVLARYGIDMCCGGFDTVEEAARRAGAVTAELVRELRRIVEGA